MTPRGAPSMSAVKSAIDAGDAARLRGALAAKPARADALILWSDRYWGLGRWVRPNRAVPLHYVCDLVFAGRLDQDRAQALADALIAAGADVNAPHPANGEPPILGAASLGATKVGLALIAAGADVNRVGRSGASALHWAAIIGDPILVEALIQAGARLDEPDPEHQSTPLGWALHGHVNPPNGSKGRQLAAAAALVRAGAVVRPEWRAAAATSRPEIAPALRGETP